MHFLKLQLHPYRLDETDNEKKKHFQEKINQYMSRAEQIKKLLPDVTSRGHVVDKIFIMEGDIGYSYESVFGKYLDNDVSQVSLEEPYIREHYQVGICLWRIVRTVRFMNIKRKNAIFIANEFAEILWVNCVTVSQCQAN